MAQKGVLRPESYEDVRSIWQQKKAKDGEKIGIDPEDSSLSALSQHEGWRILKTHIESLKMGLDKRLAQAVLGSLGTEQIKTDAIFAVLGKEMLDSIVNRVEDSSLVVEEILNERQQSGS